MFESPIDWIILALIIGAVIFGTKKAPDIAKALGKATGQFKMGQIEAQKELNDMKKNLFTMPDAKGEEKPEPDKK
jgi:sec-independent protein translocase protein TatA